MEKYQKLLDALMEIKKTCASHQRCCECPLEDKSDLNFSGCVLKNSEMEPYNWNINEVPTEWKAIKSR